MLSSSSSSAGPFDTPELPVGFMGFGAPLGRVHGAISQGLALCQWTVMLAKFLTSLAFQTLGVGGGW